MIREGVSLRSTDDLNEAITLVSYVVVVVFCLCVCVCVLKSLAKLLAMTYPVLERLLFKRAACV